VTADQTIHGSCVAWDGNAVVIQGASGRGKSALALTLMGMGCDLVADDRVILTHLDNRLMAACPPTISGLIEARGIGVLNAATVPCAQVRLVVDLDSIEHERMPIRRTVTLMGAEIPLIRAIDRPYFAAAILQILKAGWSDR